MRLRCRQNQLRALASRYVVNEGESEFLSMKSAVLKRGYLLKDELQRVAYWKAPRSSGYVKHNTEEYVREVTGFAFGATTERARIEVLTLLDGVQYPTASAILHLLHSEPYPLIDYRTLWSVSAPAPYQHSFKLWWQYVEFCRRLAERSDMDMRTLDRALWQYSKEKQP